MKRAVCLCLAIIAATCAAIAQVPDFTFLHVSDVHASRTESRETIATIVGLSEISLPQYGVTAKPPSFVVVTGDLTEFGEPKAWKAYLEYWKDVNVPIHHSMGNHDATWNCLRPELRKLYGESFYSFDQFGCHFVCLDSTTPQDPRPGFSVEELEWLKSDLGKISAETPVFVFMHHPLGGSEFASLYDRDRLLDILRPYNVVLILAGHSHIFGKYNIDGSLDCVMGGAAFGLVAGCSVVSVLDGVLRVAYKTVGDTNASRGVLEKTIPKRSDYPVISIKSPEERQTIKNAVLKISAWIELEATVVAEAWADLDDDLKVSLELKSVGDFEGETSLAGATPGAHFLRVNFKSGDKTYHKSVVFYCEPEDSKGKLLWRVQLGGSSKCTPTVANETVYVGADNGKLYTFDATNGTLKWTFPTNGEILSQPLVVGDLVIFGSGDGKVYGIGKDGQQQWSFEASSPVYSSPIQVGDLTVVGCNSGCLYAIDPITGTEKWRNCTATYTIESKPFEKDGVVYYGAWDTFVYAVNAADGSLKWKTIGRGSASKNASKYYSPADCGPVVANGTVFIPDREYKLSCLDAAIGAPKYTSNKVAGVGLSEDGAFLYLRKTDGKIAKVDLDGKEIWSVQGKANSIPTAPVEKNEVVYFCSPAGLVNAVRASDGQIIWQYQATPRLYVLSNAAVADGVAYVSGMDGSLTAIQGKEKP